MSKKLVRRTVVRSNPPALSRKQQAELKAVSAQPARKIDYSDIPPISDAFWKDAVRDKYFKPIKTSTTVRIDADVLAWLRSQGKGYQSRINAILRRTMLESLK